MAGQDREDEVRRDPPSDMETGVQGHLTTDPASSRAGVSVIKEGEVSGLVTSCQNESPTAADVTISSDSMETDRDQTDENKAILEIKIKALNREHASGNIYHNLTKPEDCKDSDNDNRIFKKDIDIDCKRQVEDHIFLFQVTLEKTDIADMEYLVTKEYPYNTAWNNAFDDFCDIKESPDCNCGELFDFKWIV